MYNMELIDQIFRAKYARESYPNDDWKLTGRWERNKFNFHESTNANIFSFWNYKKNPWKGFFDDKQKFYVLSSLSAFETGHTSKICNKSYEKVGWVTQSINISFDKINVSKTDTTNFAESFQP